MSSARGLPLTGPLIGIGSDFFGGPQGEGRGWSKDNLGKLAGGNSLRVMRAVETIAHGVEMPD